MQRWLCLLCVGIFLVPKLFGLTFSVPFVQISATGNNGTPPLLAVSSNGNAFAAWINSAQNVLQVAYFNNAPGGGWRTGSLVFAAAAPQIGIDGSGNAFVVWVQQVINLFGTTTQIFVSRLTPAWPVVPAVTTQISTTGLYNSLPQIAVSSSGIAVVTWMQTQPNQFMSRSYNPITNIWNPAIILPFNLLPASTALDSSGNGFAIFNSQNFNPSFSVQVSRISAP